MKQVPSTEPAATWHDESEPVFLKVVEVSTCPGAVNHQGRVDLLIVGRVTEAAFPSSVSSSFRQNHDESHKEDFLEMMWFSFACV